MTSREDFKDFMFLLWVKTQLEDALLFYARNAFNRGILVNMSSRENF